MRFRWGKTGEGRGEASLTLERETVACPARPGSTQGPPGPGWLKGHEWLGPVQAGTPLTQTALMSDSCPVNVCRHMLSRMSHSLTDASQAPETKVRMLGDRERDMTSPLWPVNAVVCWPVSMSHRALGGGEREQSVQRSTQGSPFVSPSAPEAAPACLPRGVPRARDDLVVVNEPAAGKIPWRGKGVAVQEKTGCPPTTPL